MRVLIVEDELAARRGLADLICGLDSRIEVVGGAANGRDGLSQIGALSPDLVFADVKMPVMDGLEMIREARRVGLKTQFVVVSAYAEFEYARQALTLDVREYLVKPVSAEEVAHVLGRLLPNVEARPGASARHPMVEKALSIIRERYREPINLTTISERLKITPEYISYLFHRDMGVNFSTYLRHFRIDRAYEMMSGGSTRIYEIAHAVGFSDAKYFCRVFREVTGKSPGAYLREKMPDCGDSLSEE